MSLFVQCAMHWTLLAGSSSSDDHIDEARHLSSVIEIGLFFNYACEKRIFFATQLIKELETSSSVIMECKKPHF